ncbi:hypothetical protein [Chthonomonas calidirosea]|uniref:hypothetical protein n=1 Tax=Chthonomonas calidirosea TaxID=454171 RepID=UPI000AD4797B|nr:hypothetical protein [Chthonomonas calidirosea]
MACWVGLAFLLWLGPAAQAQPLDNPDHLPPVQLSLAPPPPPSPNKTVEVNWYHCDIPGQTLGRYNRNDFLPASLRPAGVLLEHGFWTRQLRCLNRLLQQGCAALPSTWPTCSRCCLSGLR